MKVGDLVKRKPNPEITKEDGLGFITAGPTIINATRRALFFVRFPLTGWGQWFHPTRLEVISESR